jgi:hypothetical protein
MKKLAWFLLLAAPLVAQVSLPNSQSRVAGRFVAFNYGGWSIPLYTIPSGTGSKTFAPLYDTVQLPDGRRFVPFATTAPLYVGTEKVTVTAVGTGCTVNNTVPGACVLTATFSNLHTNAEKLSSGTFGLQEALNDASASGGGVVTIDSAWAAMGGTTTIRNAATVASSTAIEDIRTALIPSVTFAAHVDGYVILASDTNVMVNGTANAVVTLPVAGLSAGQTIRVSNNLSNSANVTVNAVGGPVIGNSGNGTSEVVWQIGNVSSFQWDGTEWWVISH